MSDSWTRIPKAQTCSKRPVAQAAQGPGPALPCVESAAAALPVANLGGAVAGMCGAARAGGPPTIHHLAGLPTQFSHLPFWHFQKTL